jgi:hypothetical protein
MSRIPGPPHRLAAVLLVLVGTFVSGTTATADVAVVGVPVTEESAPPSVTLVGQAGRRPLASPGVDGPAGQPLLAVPATVAPDRRHLAWPGRTGVRLIPTDGGAVRTLRLPGARTFDPLAGVDAPRGSSAFLSFVLGSGPRTWWTADGTSVRRAGLALDGHQVITRCTVADGRCDAQPAPSRSLFLSGLGDGASLWSANVLPLIVRLARDAGFGRWERATPAGLRRGRAALRAPVREHLTLVTADGSARTVWQRRTSSERRVRSLSPSGAGPAGTLVTWMDTRSIMRTRRRGGRLESQVRDRLVDRGAWLVAPDGAVRPLAVRPDRLGIVFEAAGPAVGDRGWLAVASTTRGTPLLALVEPGGRLSPLGLGGRTATATALWSALGVPEGTDDAGPSLGAPAYEASTGSAIVDLTWDERQVLARIPLDGGAPTVVDSAKDAEDRLLFATAW